MRILFTTAPLSGHFFSLVPLAWACRALGHEVLVATSHHFITSVVRSGLPAVSVGPGIRPRELADSGAVHGFADARYAHGRAFARMASRNLAGTLAIVDSWRPAVVVSERAELAGPLAAAARDLPHAELHWGVAELGEYTAAARTGLASWLQRLGLAGLPVPWLVLDPWPPSLRLPHARAHTGLRHIPHDGDSRLASWMFRAGDRPRICVTLGTLLPRLGTREFVTATGELLEGLTKLDHELVVAVDDEVATRLRPLPGLVRHAGRIPLSGVLASCALLVHHGGQGTALTALAAGCPQVVIPRFDDQLDNAGAVVRAGAALSLPAGEASPQRVVESCRRVLDGSGYGEAARTVAREISAQPSLVEIAGALAGLGS
jgi:L-demethylnoviosyl transferase